MPTALRNRIVGSGEERPDQLLANPANWRIHPKNQQDALNGSLETVGWVQQVMVNKRTGYVVDGHARVALALTRNEPLVPVLYVDLDPEEEALVLATLDPIAAMAGTDDAKLRELLADLTVYDAGLAAMLETLAPTEPTSGLTDPDAVPDLGEETHIKRGDLFALGDHRLMCGDSTSEADVARLADGAVADLVFTDPPYGVDYDGGTKRRQKLEGDASTELYREAVPLIPVADHASLYLWFGFRLAADVLAAVTASGWEIRNVLVWNKNLAQFGALGAHYHDKYEPAVYAFRKGKKPRWTGPTNEVTVWDVDRARSNEYHPTQKPVELVTRAIANSSHRGDAVWDAFVGSGSTIIAAEQTGRHCFAMEIDPRYVAVAIERWEKFTGKTSERIDG